MRLAPLIKTVRVGERLGSVLQQRDRLVRRGLGAGAGAAGAAREAMPAVQPRGDRRVTVAVTVAAVAVTATAVGACAYLWWRHRQAQERADLHRLEPEPPGPPPAIAHDRDTEIVSASEDGAAVPAADAVDRDVVEPAGAPAAAAARQGEALTATRSGGTGRQGQASARPSRGQRRRGRAIDGGLPRIPTFRGPQGRSDLPALAPAPSLPPSSGVATLRR